LTVSAGVRQRQLDTLLRGRSPADLGLDRAVADAQLLGSLELAGVPATWAEVTSPDPPPVVVALRAAQRALRVDARLDLPALLAWHGAALQGGALRDTELPDPGPGSDRPAPAPAIFVKSRLALMEEWLEGASGRELPPAEAGALVLARLVEIRPFTDGNGRVARLAASHLMVRGGLRPPILVGGDRARLEACLRAAFRLDTEPLTTLLREAADRGLEVMIQSLKSAESAAP
jgi:hypothetical protein